MYTVKDYNQSQKDCEHGFSLLQTDLTKKHRNQRCKV